jgi:hypothetical protein
LPLEALLRGVAAILRSGSTLLSAGLSRCSDWSLSLLSGGANGIDRAMAAEAAVRAGFALAFLLVLAAFWVLVA